MSKRFLFLRTAGQTELEHRTVPDAIELRLDGDKAPRLIGWAPVFNAKSRDLGGFQEIVKPGATAKTIQERGNDIHLLIEHMGLPLATSRGKTLTLEEDERGLRFETELEPNDPDVQRILPKIRRGDMNSTSFGFIPVKERWDHSTKPSTRILDEIRLFDVSIVSRPAYPQGEVKLRSLLAAAGLDEDGTLLPELMLRIQRGAPLLSEDRAFLRDTIDLLRSFLPEEAADIEVPNEPPTEPAPAGHSESIRGEPARTGHSLSVDWSRLERLESQIQGGTS